jgi:hypothetical protein
MNGMSEMSTVSSGGIACRLPHPTFDARACDQRGKLAKSCGRSGKVVMSNVEGFGSTQPGAPDRAALVLPRPAGRSHQATTASGLRRDQ